MALGGTKPISFPETGSIVFKTKKESGTAFWTVPLCTADPACCRVKLGRLDGHRKRAAPGAGFKRTFVLEMQLTFMRAHSPSCALLSLSTLDVQAARAASII